MSTIASEPTNESVLKGRPIAIPKPTHEKVRTSEIRYRRLFEASQDGILILNAVTLEITDVNPFMMELLGYSRDEFIGKELWEIGLFGDKGASQAAFRELQDTGYLRYEDLPLETRNGQRRKVEFVSNAYDEDGRQVIQCNIRDKSEHEPAGDALPNTQEQLAGIVDSAMDAIIMINSDWRVFLFNSAAEKMFRCPAKEAIGQLIGRFIPGRFRQAYEDVIQDFDRTDVTKRSTLKVGAMLGIRSDGEEFPIETSLSRLESNGQKFYTVALHDITDRKRAAEALRVSEENYRELFENAIDIIYTQDLEGNYTSINKAAEKITGYRREETLTRNWTQSLAPELREKMAAELRAGILSGRETAPYEMEIIAKDGRRIALEAHTRILKKDGVPVGVQGIVRDITERKRAENERNAIFEIIRGVIATPNLDEFLKLVHRSIGQIIYAENCFVMLHEPVTDVDHFAFWVDKYDPPPAPHLAGKGFGGYVLRTGKPLLITEESKKRIIKAGEAEQVGRYSPSWLGVPLRTPSRTIGVLVLQNYEDENAYSQRDLEFLSSVGDQIALAIECKE